jgi:hypothetical protein
MDEGMKAMFNAKEIEEMYRGNAEKLLSAAR